MSDTREKLKRLLFDVPCESECEGELGSCPDRKYGKCKRMDRLEYCTVQKIADHLLAHGVTVQEWVPAKDPPQESGEYIVMIHKAANPTTLMYHAGEKSWFEVTMEDGEELYTYYPVDYWMHLPIPPKEE